MPKGAGKAAAAYVIWGLLPFYWKQVEHVPALQVMAHRIFWSFVTLALLLAVRGEWRAFASTIARPRVIATYAFAAVVVSGNWYAYIWAVNSGFIVETSLGYFINPLVSVLFGVLLFGERLRPMQWLAVACAAGGVLYLTISYGKPPWVALFLAVTFAGYGVIKKIAPLNAAYGLALETALVATPALALLIFAEHAGTGNFGHDTFTTLFLSGAGIVTTVPLLLFAAAVREIPLVWIGILQYILPTLQLLAGVVFYKEPFTGDQLVGFSGVWLGLLLFGLDGWRTRR